MEDYDPELRVEISAVGIHTAPELERHAGGPAAMTRRVRAAVQSYLQRDKLVALVGGEHSISIGAVQAHAQRFPDLSVLYLDAHADLREWYEGSRYSHACVARRLLERAPVVLAGVRSLSIEEERFIEQRRLPAFFWRQPGRQPYSPEAVLAQLTPQVYISIDLDVFDPSLMAAVGTPEPGGLEWEEMLTLLRSVAERRRIVGFDVTELSPGEGPTACAYTAATLVYKLIGYALCLRPA